MSGTYADTQYANTLGHVDQNRQKYDPSQLVTEHSQGAPRGPETLNTWSQRPFGSLD